MKRVKRKAMGGAEKARKKKEKLLEKDAERCFKITDVFEASTSSVEISSETSVPDNIALSETTSREKIQALSPSTSHETGLTDFEQAAGPPPQGTPQATQVAQETLSPGVHVFPEKQQENLGDEVLKINFFTRPRGKNRKLFFEFHPKQPETSNLPFNPIKVFKTREGKVRKWPTFNEDDPALFCYICLACSRESEKSAFIDGEKDFKHIYQRIMEHEESKIHNQSVESYLLLRKEVNVDSLLFAGQNLKRKQQVEKMRHVLGCVTKVVKLIGKRGLSYRGKGLNEAAYTLGDETIDHGNFLEILLLLSECDAFLKEHLNDVIKKSAAAHARGSKGRGGLVTLISKTTINYVVEEIRQLIQTAISEEIREAVMFSVQIDTTQDIFLKDQCSIIIRYTTDRIYERLFAITQCKDSTGKGLFELVSGVIKNRNVEIANCIGSSTDGAANMQGAYNGFSAWLSDASPGQIHIWCYAHILNLVISDATQSPLEAASLFTKLNGVAAFFRESCKNMDQWNEITKDPRHGRLSLIVETRWWSKDAALSKIFGEFIDPDKEKYDASHYESSMYISLIAVLDLIQFDRNRKPEIRDKARTFKEAFLRFETILTAQLYLRIFSFTRPLSKYLQTAGMDYLKAHNTAKTTQERLISVQRDFDKVVRAANNFVKWANNCFDDHHSTNEDLILENTLPEIRVRRRKSMPGETASDETIINPLDKYRVQVYNVVMDTVVKSMQNRFLNNSKLYADLACLDPRNFEGFKDHVPTTALKKLSEKIVKFNSEATAERLQCELQNLAANWDKLKRTVPEEYQAVVDSTQEEGIQENASVGDIIDGNEDQPLLGKACKSCKNCAVCVYQVLRKYELFTSAYKALGTAYQYLLTLSSTQVACERTFSKLKFVKNRLRSTLSEEYLEAFMLMSVEKDILAGIAVEDVIRKISEKSGLLNKALSL